MEESWSEGDGGVKEWWSERVKERKRWRSEEWWREGDVDGGGYDVTFDRFKLSLVLSSEGRNFAACPF